MPVIINGMSLLNQISPNGLIGGTSKGSSPPFVPTNLPGLALWLRADLGITLDDGNVSGWADQSGNGNSFTQLTTAFQPLYKLALVLITYLRLILAVQEQPLTICNVLMP